MKFIYFECQLFYLSRATPGIEASMKINEGLMDSCEKTQNADKNFKKVLKAMELPIGCPVKAVCTTMIVLTIIHFLFITA